VAAMTKELQEDECYVALTHEPLDIKKITDQVRSPKAGAIVVFAGGSDCTLAFTFVNMS
jgi:molybdopterin synthase catalytic subunit